MAEQAVIHHYNAGFLQPNEYDVPFGTRIRSAAFNRAFPVVYVEKIVIPEGGPQRKLHVVYYATGQEFDIDGSMQFIGTVQNGPFFWHVYGKIV